MHISGFSKYIFWSYNKDADLPDDVVIKQVVTYGEIEDMVQLTKLYSKNKIKETINKLKPANKKRVNFIERVIL